MRPSLLPSGLSASAAPLQPPFDPRAFQLQFERLQRAPVRVGDCLAYPSMFDVPDAFEAWCVADFRRRRLEDASLLWVDACPAYALALCTHASGAEEPIPLTGELDLFWPGLRGHSKLCWSEAAPIVTCAWTALDRLRPGKGKAMAAPVAAGSPLSGWVAPR